MKNATAYYECACFALIKGIPRTARKFAFELDEYDPRRCLILNEVHRELTWVYNRRSFDKYPQSNLTEFSDAFHASQLSGLFSEARTYSDNGNHKEEVYIWRHISEQYPMAFQFRHNQIESAILHEVEVSQMRRVISSSFPESYGNNKDAMIVHGILEIIYAGLYISDEECDRLIEAWKLRYTRKHNALFGKWDPTTLLNTLDAHGFVELARKVFDLLCFSNSNKVPVALDIPSLPSRLIEPR